MARQIQSPQSNRPQGGKAVLGQLANAVFWFIVAVAVPLEQFLRPIPEIEPYAHWAPYVAYILALWSFIRGIRGLQRLAASRMWTPRIRVAGGSGAPPSGSSKRPRTGPIAVTRPPTVQRMR